MAGQSNYIRIYEVYSDRGAAEAEYNCRDRLDKRCKRYPIAAIIFRFDANNVIQLYIFNLYVRD